MRRALCALLLLGCERVQTEPSNDQAAGYRSYAMQTQLALHRYDESMKQALLTTCGPMFHTYELDVRTPLDRMTTLAPDLDALIVEHDGAAYADVACVTTAMTDELAAHAAAACQGATIEDDRAEATRHVDVLGGYLAHAITRTNELSAGLAGDGFIWSLANGCP